MCALPDPLPDAPRPVMIQARDTSARIRVKRSLTLSAARPSRSQVAKSRIMAQAALPDGTMPYNGTLDCWRKVVANEGPLALYKGFVPGWLRLGPWQLVFWCSYEQLRILSGLGGFQ